MPRTHAVGIDLGTTYSCIACLNRHGEPITIPNQEGEAQTPSVVMFDGNDVIVGREALRHAVSDPGHVVQNSKRSMGDSGKTYQSSGRTFTPVEIASLILRKLLDAAEEKIGPIEQAVVTVPTQFSELQRQATVEAGRKAGLKRVDIINEPVAAALCAVLGTEGLWFAELADEQRILVFDLGGGTFDLSLVQYEKNEVRVLAGSGDLHLGGTDWNRALVKAIAEQFIRDFKDDPRDDPESEQALALEVEEAKRSLSVRERAPLACQHAGFRKLYRVERAKFERLTQPLVDRAASITRKMLSDNRFGWANVDMVMTTGGASRMPMVRNMLKNLSGRTLNTSLSPDQSIAHGAAYFAGMLLSHSGFEDSTLTDAATRRLSRIRQMSINSRALGILVDDRKTGKRVPHYLIKANSTLPVSVSQTFSTVVPNQKRIHVHVVESGVTAEQPHVELGACIVQDLPEKLPQASAVEVSLRYDAQARVHVEARDVTSGQAASTDIVRPEILCTLPVGEAVQVIPTDAEVTDGSG
jgi:molecular chaperone DnaK